MVEQSRSADSFYIGNTSSPSGHEVKLDDSNADTDNARHLEMKPLNFDEKDSAPRSSTGSRISDDIASTKHEVLAIHENSVGSDDAIPPNLRTWRTTFFRSGPLAGLCCMLLAALSILVSFGILMGSRGAAVLSWNVQPSAYLAICSAVANQALRFASFQGVIIAWWCRASRGTTLRQLHRDWRAGMTILGALSNARNMGFIGLACILSTLVAIDGPLLQKATNVVSAPIGETMSLNVSLAPEVPTGFTGGWYKMPNGSNQMPWSPIWNDTIPTLNGNGGTSNNIIPLQHPMDPLSAAWLTEAPMKGFVQGCKSKCKAKLRAPALAVTACTTKLMPVNYTQTYAFPPYNLAAPLDRNAFILDTAILLDTHESINLISAHATVNDCAGTLSFTICTLDAAVGEYDVLIDNDIVTLASPGVPNIIALANNTQIGAWDEVHRWHPSTLAGIAALGIYTAQGANIWYDDPKETPHMSQYTIGAITEKFRLYDDQKCSSFIDAKDYALRQLNSIMFEAGVVAAQTENASYIQSLMDPGLQVNSVVTGYVEGEHNVFHTDLHWFLAAALVEGICIALILPTYWGWWLLGRPVSFSPLEVAKAFGAPMLSNCNSNASGRDIAKADVGATRVQYGASQANGRMRLGFANPARVERPRESVDFDV